MYCTYQITEDVSFYKSAQKREKTFFKPFGYFLHDYADRRSDKTQCFFSGNAKDTKFDSFICNFSISIEKAGSLSKTVTARFFQAQVDLQTGFCKWKITRIWMLILEAHANNLDRKVQCVGLSQGNNNDEGFRKIKLTNCPLLKIWPMWRKIMKNLWTRHRHQSWSWTKEWNG